MLLDTLMIILTGRSIMTSNINHILITHNNSLRCFLRRYESFASIDEEDLTMLIKKYDRDVDGGWGFREFINTTTPLLQFTLKAKGL